MSLPESICIVRLSAIGDVCNAISAVQAIQRHYPDSKLTWIVGKLEYQLVKSLPDIEFIIFDKKEEHAFRNIKASMKGRRFDVLLHMQVALRANWLARLVPAKRKIGYDWKRAKEGHALVTNERISTLSSDNTKWHALDGFLSFATKLGVPESECYPVRWNIPIADQDKDYALSKISTENKTLVICPAASKRERCWLPERYAALADYAAKSGYQVILCGGPNELDQELSSSIQDISNTKIDSLIGETSIPQLYALLADADIVVAPDTGPLHMANAAGTAVIGLYAHSNPERTGPYNNQNNVVSVYAQVLKEQLGNTPEQAKWGQRVKGEDLMERISTNMVIAKFDALSSMTNKEK